MKQLKKNVCYLCIFFSRALLCELRLEPLSIDTLESRVSLGLCIAETSKTYFAGSGPITYSLPLAGVVDPKSFYLLSDSVLSSLQAEQQGTFLLMHVKSLWHAFDIYHQVKSQSYIVQIRIQGEFSEIIKELNLLSSWNPHAMFLVVSATLFDNPNEIASEITEVLWKYNVIDVAILLADPKNSTNYITYSWEPYSDKSCGNNFFNTMPIGSCFFGTTRGNVSWFGDKITKELYNCTITASYIKWAPFVTGSSSNPGIEIKLLNMIAETLHLYVIYEESNETYWGNVYENKTSTGDMRLLYENEIDLVLGGYTQSYARSVFFDCSRSYLQDTLVWCVPHVPILLGLNSLISIISGEVWIGVLSIYLIVTAGVWYLSRHHPEEFAPYKLMRNAILNTFAVLIGFSADSLPKSNMVRYLISLLILFSLYLNMIYSSYLTSMLSSHNFKEKYSAMEDIYRYNLETYFIPDTTGYFQGSDSNKYNNYIGNVPVRVIHEKWKDCYNSTACFDRVLFEKDAAFCTPKLYKEYLFSNIEYLNKNKKKLYCLKDQVVTYPIIIIMRNGFPLYSIFQRIIDRINNVGFISKWEKDILVDKHNSVFSDIDDIIDETSIKMENLRPVFGMMIIIHLVAIFVFIIEIISHKNIFQKAVEYEKKMCCTSE